MDENTEFDVNSIDDSAIDAAWNDETEETPNESEQDSDTEADQQKEPDKPAEAPATDAEDKKDEPKPDATPSDVKVPSEDQLLTFTLKHLDEVKTVDRNEVVKLAQQGMDYERVRTERDQLREYRKEADPALNLLKSYADKNGMTVSQYVDFVRKQEIIGSGVNEQTAKAQIDVEKREAAVDAKEKKLSDAETQDKKQEDDRKAKEAEETQRAEKRKQEMKFFIEKYPGLNPDNDIPKEVWIEVSKGVSLLTAYTEFRNKQLEIELAASKQNAENVKKTTGSAKSIGEKTGLDAEIDKWWNDES